MSKVTPGWLQPVEPKKYETTMACNVNLIIGCWETEDPQ